MSSHKEKTDLRHWFQSCLASWATLFPSKWLKLHRLSSLLIEGLNCLFESYGWIYICKNYTCIYSATAYVWALPNSVNYNQYHNLVEHTFLFIIFETPPLLKISTDLPWGGQEYVWWDGELPGTMHKVHLRLKADVWICCNVQVKYTTPLLILYRRTALALCHSCMRTENSVEMSE